MRRVPDLIDVWFDSGAMPFAQWHYPFENEERFAANAPADFIAEGVDQTRGWFYTMHAIAALVDDRLAYKNVVVNGLLLDAEGQKMSKSKGNAVDPFAAIERHGVDPIRWSMMASSPPWENLRYSDDAVEETRRKTFGTLVNTYKFFATYAGIDGFAYDASSTVPDADRTELDRWILSRLQSTIAEAEAALDAYHPTRAARSIESFIDDLSNWYLRRSRRRFWSKTSSELQVESSEGESLSTLNSQLGTEKRAAYETLYECLEAVSRLMAPIAPFTSDWLYRLLTEGDTSVHLTRYPKADGAGLDAELEDRMGLARAVVTATLALRNEAAVNVRQPLRSLLVVTGVGGVDEAVLRSVEDVILDEVNVKALETASGDSGVVSKSAKPNFKALGRRLGPRMKAAGAAIRQLDGAQIAQYESDGALTLALDDGPVELATGDLEITSEGVEGRLVRQETTEGAGGRARTVTVALDTQLDDALRAEGLARELVNRVQTLRKEAGFDVSDRIELAVAGPDALARALAPHTDWVQAETLARSFSHTPQPEGEATAETTLGDHAVTIAVRRV